MSEMENNERSGETPAASVPASPGRRRFLSSVAAAPVIATVAGLPAVKAADSGTVTTQSDEIGPLDPDARRLRAARQRRRANVLSRERPLPNHPNNGDETNFPNYINNFHKGLPHDQLGIVDPAAYQAFVAAIASGNPADFGAVPGGCADPAQQRPLVDPQSAHNFTLTGPDGHQSFMPPAPAFDSAWTAGEMVEMYWAACTRDVPFRNYDTDPLIALACAELSQLSDFRGPKENGQVTPRTYLRTGFAGESVGPYISQFLLRPSPLGTAEIPNMHMTYVPGADFLTNYPAWLARQNGCAPDPQRPFDPVRRIIRNGRDIAANVNVDLLAQSYFQAVVLMGTTEGVVPQLGMPSGIGGIGTPPDENHPYRANGANFHLQEPLGQLGAAWVLATMWEVSQRALAAQWFQKYAVHRRGRPEYYGGHVHNHVTGAANYPIGDEVLNSSALSKVFSLFGTYLLPIAFPEGSPTHPAYGSGHATVAGACVTILKAFFDTSIPFADPVIPTQDGLSLTPYTGADAGDLTIGGELNKLAMNVTQGRTHGGVHWRSDGIESNLVGEAVAIGLLEEMAFTYNFDFPIGFNLTKFDGTQITVGGGTSALS